MPVPEPRATTVPGDAADHPPARRLTISVRPETFERLQRAREEIGLALNVSQICDSAINGELDRQEKANWADVIARLRVESDRRRGAPFRLGYLEGESWARTKGSWAEICGYAELDEGDVRIDKGQWTSKDGRREWWIPRFVGAFTAPEQDYARWTPHQHGAPGFTYDDEEGAPECDASACDQYWRGWLSAVREVFAVVSGDLEPIAPQRPPAARPASREAEPTPGSGDIDPDDIPF